MLMTVRYANKQEVAHWNDYILANDDGGNVFASYEFAMQKETGGYLAKFVFIDDVAVTVLEKNTPPLGKFWYLPKGPGVTATNDLFEVLKSLKALALDNNVFTIRIEPELDRSYQPTLGRNGLIKARPIIPNPSTITLDISPSLEDILISLPQKGRHAIRRAERDGVTVKQVASTDKNCKIMYSLLEETAKGQFGIRGYEYFRTFWRRFEAAGYGQMFFAYFDGKVVAGAYAMVYGAKSTYKDGASVRIRNVYGASHLLQWQVIKWAKSHGALIHDFCGSPPSEEINNADHPHFGVGQFKTAFNKTVTDYIGCYDFVISRPKYLIWAKIGERIAHRIHYYKHRDSYY